MILIAINSQMPRIIKATDAYYAAPIHQSPTRRICPLPPISLPVVKYHEGYFTTSQDPLVLSEVVDIEI